MDAKSDAEVGPFSIPMRGNESGTPTLAGTFTVTFSIPMKGNEEDEIVLVSAQGSSVFDPHEG